jgi:hypothetical protein
MLQWHGLAQNGTGLCGLYVELHTDLIPPLLDLFRCLELLGPSVDDHESEFKLHIFLVFVLMCNKNPNKIEFSG